MVCPARSFGSSLTRLSPAATAAATKKSIAALDRTRFLMANPCVTIFRLSLGGGRRNHSPRDRPPANSGTTENRARHLGKRAARLLLLFRGVAPPNPPSA